MSDIKTQADWDRLEALGKLPDPDDLPVEAYDPHDFRDIGGMGVEPR
jgi:hypothetical protein